MEAEAKKYPRGIDADTVQQAWDAVGDDGRVAVAEPNQPGATEADVQSETKPALVGMTQDELTEFVAPFEEKKFRAKQLYEWLYHHRAPSFDEMTNLSKAFRVELAQRADVLPIKLADRRPAGDGSVKLLFELSDGQYVEGVLMPERDRLTLCVSSQVGCAVDCKFCLTGLMGFRRNLTAGEIVGQVILASHDPLAKQGPAHEDRQLPLTNIVFMGMGEPLLNPRGVLKAIALLTDTNGRGFGMSAKRITVSTAGVVPGIDKLSDARLGVKLAVSLNGTTNEQRAEVMPINNAFSIEQLFASIRRYEMPKTHRVTLEYVLLEGVNDAPEDARRLAKLAQGLRGKINLIPLNPDPELPYKRPTREAVEAFQQILCDEKLTANVRWSKGLDVDAACGQLAGRWRPKDE